MAKPRVYELAKVLNVDSKTVLEKLKDMGEFVKSASSTIEPPVARRLKAEFAKDNAKGDSKPVQQRRPAAPSAPASTSSSAPTPAAPARQASPASAHQQAPTPGAPTPRPQGVNFTALDNRLRSTCPTRAPSTQMRGCSPSATMRMPTPFA